MSLETDFPSGESISVIEKREEKSWARLLVHAPVKSSLAMQLFLFDVSHYSACQYNSSKNAISNFAVWPVRERKALCACFPAPRTCRERNCHRWRSLQIEWKRRWSAQIDFLSLSLSSIPVRFPSRRTRPAGFGWERAEIASRISINIKTSRSHRGFKDCPLGPVNIRSTNFKLLEITHQISISFASQNYFRRKYYPWQSS